MSMRANKSFGTAAGLGGGRDPVNVTVKLTGVEANRKARRKLRDATDKGAVKGLKRALEYWLSESLKITPFKTGYLRGTGHSVILSEKPPKGRIEFGASYAVYVHEDLEKQHAPGTYAKFLERIMKNRRHIAIGRSLMQMEISKAQRKALR